MAGNSNNKQNKNNNHNPTLRDHERMKGHSGHAVHEKGVLSTDGSRTNERGQSERTFGEHDRNNRNSGHE